MFHLGTVKDCKFVFVFGFFQRGGRRQCMIINLESPLITPKEAERKHALTYPVVSSVHAVRDCTLSPQNSDVEAPTPGPQHLKTGPERGNEVK